MAPVWSVYTSNCVIMEPTLIWLSANLIYTHCHNTGLTRHLASPGPYLLLTLQYMYYLDIFDSSTKMGQCLSNFSAVYNQNWSPEPRLDTNLIKDQSKLWWLLLSLGGHWPVPGHSVPSPALNSLTLNARCLALVRVQLKFAWLGSLVK